MYHYPNFLVFFSPWKNPGSRGRIILKEEPIFLYDPLESKFLLNKESWGVKNRPVG